MSLNNDYFGTASMERDWPPYMDIFTGDTPVKKQLAAMAKVSSRFSPELVADMVGRDVTDQYVYARDHTNLRVTKFVLNATTGLANIFANNVMKIVGLGASLWVDYAVFGGAAASLFGSHLNAFGVGAAIFATWLGLKHDEPLSKKVLPILCLGVASAGASLILVSQEPQSPTDPNFRAPFTQLLATQFPKGNTDERTNVSTYEGQIVALTSDIDAKRTRLTSGGNGGQNMLSDGSTGNDEEAQQLVADIAALESSRRDATINKNTEQARLVTATEQDPVDFWGRIFAALYIGTWLFASQALVANIIGSVRQNHKENYPKAKNEAARRKHLEDFRHFIEHPDQTKRENFIRTTVGNVTTQFAGVLYAVSPESQSADKHNKFASLFEGDTRERIQQLAFEYVNRTVEPRSPK